MQIKTLLVTGQSNQWHNWRLSSETLARIVGDSGLCELDVVVSPEAGEDMSQFDPQWDRYDVVILDYEGDAWPDAARNSFVEYVRDGGGVVVYHAADNAFPDWPEYNEIIGIGGWGERTQEAGPMVRWRAEKMVLVNEPGDATHPNKYDFIVTTRTPEHPIMKGLPEEWLHAHDEMYSQLRGPAKNLTVLATACADPSEVEGGTGENEPMLMTIEYGKGRVFHTTLGHVGMDDSAPVTAMNCKGFVVTFLRGLEWAARGEVSQAIPEDFPSASSLTVCEVF